jgi:hypothetical protein
MVLVRPGPDDLLIHGPHLRVGPPPQEEAPAPLRREPIEGGSMDAIAMLKADHDKVKELLTELESTTERGVKRRTELFSTIKEELTVHEVIEEEVFYPALKAHPKAKDIVLEAYEEHHVVDVLMGELSALDVSDETWGAKALVMKENVEHHIEEEEGEMFRQARRIFDAAELRDLGDRMAARKEAALAEVVAAP